MHCTQLRRVEWCCAKPCVDAQAWVTHARGYASLPLCKWGINSAETLAIGSWYHQLHCLEWRLTYWQFRSHTHTTPMHLACTVMHLTCCTMLLWRAVGAPMTVALFDALRRLVAPTPWPWRFSTLGDAWWHKPAPCLVKCISALNLQHFKHLYVPTRVATTRPT